MRFIFLLSCFIAISLSLVMTACTEDKPSSVKSSFPFPSNKGPGAYCRLPSSASNAEALHAYQVWKKTLVRREGANGFRRVIRPDTPDGAANTTVSEGIAYGMILSVYFDDQELFDDLFHYALYWADETGLMKWYIDPTGTIACPGREFCGAATDSDEDMAFALIMADHQWGGRGKLDKSYQDYALRQISLVKQYEVDSETYIIKPGNQWGGPELLNLSYFAPAFYNIFGQYSDDEVFWNKVIDENYRTLFNNLNEKNGNVDNGLVSAWSNAKGEPVIAFPGAPTHYQTDSARMPFRIGQHYCWTGDQRAKRYLDKVNRFFTGIGATRLTDGYDLNGTPRPEAAPAMTSRSAVVVAGAAVAAMADGAHPEFVDTSYDLVKSLELTVRSTYYQLSWSAMSMAFMTGNYFDLTSIE